MSSRARWSVHLAISRHMAAVFKLADFWHDIVEQYGAPSYVPTQVLPYYCWAGITVNEESEVWTRLPPRLRLALQKVKLPLTGDCPLSWRNQ